MKVSLSWLKNYLPGEYDVQRLADGLTMVGLEVDAVTERYAYLDAVIVGRIAAVSAHPNADRLTCCQVDTGKGRVGHRSGICHGDPFYSAVCPGKFAVLRCLITARLFALAV